jgi:hypothetical protein
MEYRNRIIEPPFPKRLGLAGKTRTTGEGLPVSFGTVGVLWEATARAEKYG